MNPLDLFSSTYTFKRTYLNPPTSQKNLPTDMSQLDNFLEKRNNKLNPKKVIVGAKPAFNKKL